MYYVYVIRSLKDQTFYIGYTNSLQRRIDEHNYRKGRFTKFHVPWELLYYEAFKELYLAKQREKMLKESGRSWQELRKRLGIHYREKQSLINPLQDSLF